jgi:hypothetical protein
VRGARTHGLAKRTERVRTYHGTARHGGADGALHRLAAGSESTRRGLAGVRQSCALGNGAGTRGRRRLGCGTQMVVGALSVFQTTRRVLGGYSRGTHGPVRGTLCAGQWNGPCGVLTEYEHAMGYCERYRVRHGAAPLPRGCCQRTQAHVRRGHAHGSATVRARIRRGAYGHQRAGARTHAQAAASRARRAHRKLNKLSADSAAGIVPSSEFELKYLQRAWFVPLCSEMLMHRSVPRTHTSTARASRMGLRPRGYCTRVLEGVLSVCPLRARGDERYSSRAAVRTHLPWYVYAYSKGH